MLLFIWARPPRFLVGPAHAHPCTARTSLLPPCSHYHRGLPVSTQQASVRTATRHPRVPRPCHGQPGHGRGATRQSGTGPKNALVPRGTPTAGPPCSPLLFPSLPRRRPSRSNVTEPLIPFPVTNSSLAPLSSTASLPTIFAPVPLPQATGGLSLASDFAERRRCLPPLW
jgi:hypothetical protein